VRVVTSVVKSDHKAVVAIPEGADVSVSNTRQKRTSRLKTPSQNASFLQCLATADLNARLDPGALTQDGDPQKYYDTFYTTALDLLDTFYPGRTITVRSRDPAYVTPCIKAKLRRKNRLMRAGCVEEAGALASQIGRDITRRSKRQLHRISGKTDTKELWAAVRRLTRGQHEPAVDPSITADVLNRHYAAISHDDNYEPPLQKQSVSLLE